MDFVVYKKVIICNACVWYSLPTYPWEQWCKIPLHSLSSISLSYSLVPSTTVVLCKPSSVTTRSDYRLYECVSDGERSTRIDCYDFHRPCIPAGALQHILLFCIVQDVISLYCIMNVLIQNISQILVRIKILFFKCFCREIKNVSKVNRTLIVSIRVNQINITLFFYILFFKYV